MYIHSGEVPNRPLVLGIAVRWRRFSLLSSLPFLEINAPAPDCLIFYFLSQPVPNSCNGKVEGLMSAFGLARRANWQTIGFDRFPMNMQQSGILEHSGLSLQIRVEFIEASLLHARCFGEANISLHKLDLYEARIAS